MFISEYFWQEYFSLSLHEFLNKGSFFFSFRETVIFVVSHALLKLVGTTSGSNHWISGRRRIFFCVMMLTPNLVLLGEISLILPGLVRRPWVSLADDSEVRKGWEGTRSFVKRSL